MSESFNGRNMYYLRLSEDLIMPLYVFLDEQHITWMSNVVLQRVLSDLRPRLVSKLKAEAKAQSQMSICSVQGDTYQFCYFFRKIDPHSLLLKLCTSSSSPFETPKRGNKRKTRSLDESTIGSTARSKKKRDGVVIQTDEIGGNVSPSATMSVTADVYHLEDDIDQDVRERIEAGSPSRNTSEVGLDFSAGDIADIQEEKPKPQLQIRFQGFQLYGKCLCVVIEPLAEEAIPTPNRSPATEVGRAKTPLFLPDLDHDVSDPLSLLAKRIPSFGNQASNNDTGRTRAGMVAFSQRLGAMEDYITSLAGNDVEDVSPEALVDDADDVDELRES
ncbi:hypothetical protein AX17_001303 [Amanita inopinata Kibby_2008]|nr:hypothetical protein AX17_001303 [Amanita inopinata Kibby_2008]